VNDLLITLIYVHHKSRIDGLGSNREFLGDSLETTRLSTDMVRHYSVEPHSIRVILNLWVRDTNEKAPHNIFIGGRKQIHFPKRCEFYFQFLNH